MKYLLNGVAIAAALAITAPAWAQGAPASPPKPMAAPAAPAKPVAAKPTSGMPMKAKHHMMHHKMGSMMNAGDKMTEQLNQQELARITGGGAPAAPPPPPPQGGGMGQQPGK